MHIEILVAGSGWRISEGVNGVWMRLCHQTTRIHTQTYIHTEGTQQRSVVQTWP